MDTVIAAVGNDLVGRFIAFLVNMSPNRACSDEQKMERLRQLLLRAHMVVDEADGRRITNTGMLVQLKTIAAAMYRGYHVLDAFECRHLKEGADEEEVSDESSSSAALYLPSPLKRLRLAGGRANRSSTVSHDHELQSAVDNLESVAANMTEFVLLLTGCERMCRRPYDAYIYTDNFMFGRHSERQQIVNVLLQHDPFDSTPAVLPVIGGSQVGKKTLVAHVCRDERVRSHFSSILHLNGESLSLMDRERRTSGRTLFVVEFLSDVGDEDWEKFYNSSAICAGNGSKVIIISRSENSARFGTVRHVRLSSFSHEEYSYLFKTLAFGSTDPEDHPRLVSIAKEFPTVLNCSLVSGYTFADLLRKNMRTQFWLEMLRRCRLVVKKNSSMDGKHPILRLYEYRPIDITSFVPSSRAPLLLLNGRSQADVSKRELPKVTFGDLILDPSVLPEGEFDLVMWESRIPPYAKTIHFVPTYAEEKTVTSLLGRKRTSGAICLLA